MSVTSVTLALQEVLKRQKEACDAMREELSEIEDRRHEQRGITQKWHFLKGSVAWLQNKSADGAAGGEGGGEGSFKQSQSQGGTEQLRVLRRLNEVEEQVTDASQIKEELRTLMREYRKAQAMVHVIECLGSLSKWPPMQVDK